MRLNGYKSQDMMHEATYGYKSQDNAKDEREKYFFFILAAVPHLFKIEKHVYILSLTFPINEDARMVKEQVSEGVALWVQPRFLAETRGLEPREVCQGPQGGLTARHCHS